MGNRLCIIVGLWGAFNELYIKKVIWRYCANLKRSLNISGGPTHSSPWRPPVTPLRRHCSWEGDTYYTPCIYGKYPWHYTVLIWCQGRNHWRVVRIPQHFYWPPILDSYIAIKWIKSRFTFQLYTMQIERFVVQNSQKFLWWKFSPSPLPRPLPSLFLGLRSRFGLRPKILGLGASRHRFGLHPIRTPNFWSVVAPLFDVIPLIRILHHV